MRFKRPKKITIGDTVFRIKYDSKTSGGNFKYPEDGKPGKITIGTRDVTKDGTSYLATLIHELSEIIHIEQSTRLWHRGTDTYIFISDHAQHTDLCCRLSGLLQKFIK